MDNLKSCGNYISISTMLFCMLNLKFIYFIRKKFAWCGLFGLSGTHLETQKNQLPCTKHCVILLIHTQVSYIRIATAIRWWKHVLTTTLGMTTWICLMGAPVLILQSIQSACKLNLYPHKQIEQLFQDKL